LWTFTLLAFLTTLAYSAAPVDAAIARLWRSLVLFPTGPWLDGVLWTLTVEVIFYIVILLLLIAGRLAALERLTRWWVGLCAVLLALGVAGAAGVALPGPLAALAALQARWGDLRL